MDVVEFADQAANRRKVVLVAALDGTFDRKNFNRILELIPLAEHVTKLNAVCSRFSSISNRQIKILGLHVMWRGCCFYKTSRS